MNKINVRLSSRAFTNLRNDPLSKINVNLTRLGIQREQTSTLCIVELLRRANEALKQFAQQGQRAHRK